MSEPMDIDIVIDSYPPCKRPGCNCCQHVYGLPHKHATTEPTDVIMTSPPPRETYTCESCNHTYAHRKDLYKHQYKDKCSGRVGYGELPSVLYCKCRMCKIKSSLHQQASTGELHPDQPEVLRIIHDHQDELMSTYYNCDQHDTEYRTYNLKLPADVDLQGYLWAIYFAQDNHAFDIMSHYGYITRHADTSRLIYLKAFDAINLDDIYRMKIYCESDFEDYVDWFIRYEASLSKHVNSAKTNIAIRVFPITNP